MGLMSNFRFHKKNFVKRDPKLSEYISWLQIDESGIVYNKDDSMQLTFKFRGPDLDSSTIEELQEVFKNAAKEPFYEGILGVSEEPLVSIDYRGNSHSSIVDLPLINVVDKNLVKVVAWYDNEWGYSNRLVELAADFGKN